MHLFFLFHFIPKTLATKTTRPSKAGLWVTDAKLGPILHRARQAELHDNGLRQVTHYVHQLTCAKYSHNAESLAASSADRRFKNMTVPLVCTTSTQENDSAICDGRILFLKLKRNRNCSRWMSCTTQLFSKAELPSTTLAHGGRDWHLEVVSRSKVSAPIVVVGVRIFECHACPDSDPFSRNWMGDDGVEQFIPLQTFNVLCW